MTSLTRGPLPARVYWRRRLLILGLALLLVVGVGRLLGAGSDGSSQPDQATPAAADPTTSAPPTPSVSAETRKPRKPTKSRTKVAPVLADPDGPCSAEEIAVAPDVSRAVAGPRGGAFIVLGLRSVESEACTWEVSAKTLTLKITSGTDDIWSSRECPSVVPTREVVVRSNATTRVGISWNVRRSDEDCSRRTEYAMPGYYHLAAAALAGEPSDMQFELVAPTAPVITRAPEPTPSPSAAPSGAVEPDRTSQRD